VLDIADRLIASVSAPISLLNGQEVAIGASIGVAISMDGGTDASHLLLEADAAL
jgi:GGDEF domain-containing protein